MDKKWVLQDLPPADQIEDLRKSINVSQAIATLLLQRGIDNYEDAKAFFRAELDHLHDPWLMRDMDKAAHRLKTAIEAEEKILFYGDYDVDGTTSVAMCYAFFKPIYPHIAYYIPDRYSEGYGLSDRGVDYAIEHNFTLVVTLDCGIKALEKVQRGQDAGIDFIICDHHTPGAALPPAYAVLDPKRADCPYPYKELSGCGVGFKLIQAFAELAGTDKDKVFALLDLLAISIACDIVPITGENRILCRYGLERMAHGNRIGITALLAVAGLSKQLRTSDLVFGLGPRINAAGRIEHANQAVKLLISQDAEEAEALAKEINEKNQQRQILDRDITAEALAYISDNHLQNHSSTVLYQKDWHKGVIGIVASRCIEHYHRPTIILTESNGKAAGSARSVPGFNVYDAIEACSELIEQFGGHKYAAGLTMPAENIPQFQQRFEEVVASTINPQLLVPTVRIDAVLELWQINERFFNVVQQMAPFGPKNMQPVFASENVQVVGQVRIMKDRHLKFTIKQEGNEAKSVALFFNGIDHLDTISSGKPFHLCYQIQMNEFRGFKSLELFVRDLKAGHWQPSEGVE